MEPQLNAALETGKNSQATNQCIFPCAKYSFPNNILIVFYYTNI